MKILILSFFLLPFSFLFSQGNLQFNQVISTGGTTSTANPGSPFPGWANSIAYTVPIGKVWKLEYFFGGQNGWVLAVNNITMYYTFTNSTILDRTNIIWLKAGDVLKISTQYNGAVFYFSGIEFNIIP